MSNFFSNTKGNDLIMIRSGRIKGVVAGKDKGDLVIMSQIETGLIDGTSAYDSVNNRLGIGITTPVYDLDVTKSVAGSYVLINVQNTSSTGYSSSEVLSNNGTTYAAISVFNTAGGVGTFYDNSTAGLATNSSLSFLTNENATGGWVITVGGYGAANEAMRWDSNKNVSIGSGVLATTATNGFLYVTACAGVPTGVPTSKTGRIPIVVDSTNNKLYIYSGGSWVALN